MVRPSAASPDRPIRHPPTQVGGTGDDHDDSMNRAALTPPTRSRDTAEPGDTLRPVSVRADDSASWGLPGGGPRSRADVGDSALSSYLRAIRSHVPLVIAVMIATLLVALAWGQLRTPTYEASAQMLITPLAGDDTAFIGMPYVRDTGDPPRTLQTAATLVDSPRAAQLAASRLGHGWTQAKVQSAVTVTPEGQSSIVDITGSSDSAKDSAHVANTFAQAVIDSRTRQLQPLIDRAMQSTRAQLSRLAPGSPSAQTLAQRVRQLEDVRGDDPTIAISQVASPPVSASGIGTSLLAVLALIVGLALGTLAAFVVDLVRPRRIADEEELLGLYRLPVLARIPVLPRRARRRAAASPLVIPPTVREGFRTLQVQLELQPGRHRSILFTSASSGDGKTTSAVNFAVELVGAGKRVILLDLDLRKPDVGRSLEVSPRMALPALLDEGTRLESALVDVAGVAGLQVLPLTPGDGFPALERLIARLPDLVAEALSLADYVVIDTAPVGEVSDALKMTGAVDDVLLVARIANTRLASFETMRELLERTRNTPTGIVLIGTSAREVSGYYYYGYGTAPTVSAK
jgi:capsular exopolysaccharide synthesis family protein